MAYGNHIFIAFGLQANTHVNVHQDLKDVKLWQVTLFHLVFIFSLVLDSNHQIIFILAIACLSN